MNTADTFIKVATSGVTFVNEQATFMNANVTFINAILHLHKMNFITIAI